MIDMKDFNLSRINLADDFVPFFSQFQWIYIVSASFRIVVADMCSYGDILLLWNSKYLVNRCKFRSNPVQKMHN